MITVTIKADLSIPLVIPAGRIDSISSSEFGQALQSVIEQGNFLIIDMSQCEYLSSAGIRIILLYEKKLLARGGGLFLSGLLPEVFQVLEMSGLNKVFHLFQNIEAARSEIERLELISKGSGKWLDGAYSFNFYPIENKKDAAFIWKSPGIAGYNELGFSVGIGSPAETPEEDPLIRGVFISIGHCSGFFPDDPRIPSDFRIPEQPAGAGIFVNRALSFGGQPSGQVRLSDPASISLEHLVEAIYPIKQRFKSGEPDLMALVIVNFEPGNHSVSLCALVDQELNELLKLSEFTVTEGLIAIGTNGLRLWGARFLLSDIPPAPVEVTLPDFLKKVLTFENIIEVAPLSHDDHLINPVCWMFVSNGVSDPSAKRLKIETDDFILEPHIAFLTRRLYTDSGRVKISRIHGGYSAQTFQVTSYDHEGRKLRPTVMKIADRAMISRESDRCKRYANPYILNNSAMVLGTEFFGNAGALRYNFVGIGGEQTRLRWLTHYFHNWTTEQLEPLFDKIFLQILHPWYGQPIQEVIHPFQDHDPRSTFFPQLCETASDQLSISPDEKFFNVKEVTQQLVNPYWFLNHEFASRRETEINYYTSICHGDLNMQNILLDEDMNVYLIDFSETKPRSVISDFARLEAIFMVDNAPLHDEKETEVYLKFICSFYDTVRLDQKPDAIYVGDHSEQVSKNVALTMKMREYAFKSVGQNTDPVPYCMALLEWIMPIVCYSSATFEHKRLSMIVSGLICKTLIGSDLILPQKG